MKTLLAALLLVATSTFGQIYTPGTGGSGSVVGAANLTNAAVNWFSQTNSTRSTNQSQGVFMGLTNQLLTVQSTNFGVDSSTSARATATNLVAGTYSAGFQIQWESLVTGSYQFAILTNGVICSNLTVQVTNAVAGQSYQAGASGLLFIGQTNTQIGLFFRCMTSSSGDMLVRSGGYFLTFYPGGAVGATGSTGPAGSLTASGATNAFGILFVDTFSNVTNNPGFRYVPFGPEFDITGAIQATNSSINWNGGTTFNIIPQATAKGWQFNDQGLFKAITVGGHIATIQCSTGNLSYLNLSGYLNTPAVSGAVLHTNGNYVRTNTLTTDGLVVSDYYVQHLGGASGFSLFEQGASWTLSSITGDLIPASTNGAALNIGSAGGGVSQVGTIYGSNAVLATDLTLNKQTANSILYVDGSKKVQSVTIGSGVTFAGGTLTGSGGSSSVPLEYYSNWVTNGISTYQAIFYATNANFGFTFTNIPAKDTGERFELTVSNYNIGGDITMTLTNVTVYDYDQANTVSSFLIPSNSLWTAYFKYGTNQIKQWVALRKDGLTRSPANGTYLTLGTNGPSKTVFYDPTSVTGTGISFVLSNGASINAPNMSGTWTPSPGTSVGTASTGVSSINGTNITALSGGSFTAGSSAYFVNNQQTLSAGTTTTNLDLASSGFKDFTNVMSGNLTINFTNIQSGGLAGRSGVARFLGASATTNTVKFGVVPTAGTNLTWFSPTNGTYDLQVLPGATCEVFWQVTSPTNIDLSWTTTARLPINIQAGQSSSNATVAGYVLNQANLGFTNLNALGTMSNLASLSLSAHTLTNAGDTVIAEWRGKLKNTTVSANQFQIVLGSTTLLDTGLQSSSNSAFTAWAEITKTANSAQHVDAWFSFSAGSAPYAFTNVNIESAENMGTALTLVLKGGASAVGSHTNNVIRAKYIPATQ